MRMKVRKEVVVCLMGPMTGPLVPLALRVDGLGLGLKAYGHLATRIGGLMVGPSTILRASLDHLAVLLAKIK